MNEHEWMTSTNPQAMLAFSNGATPWKPGKSPFSDRKLRLFAVACCRASWHHFGNSARRAVEIAEAHADGQASLAQVQAACEIILPGSGIHQSAIAHNEVRMLCWQADIAAMCIAEPGHAIPPEQKAALLREIVGNPWKPVTLAPSWLTPPVLALARSAYDSRDFSALGILADALEESGCTSADLLMHLRGIGPHVRGCHVVDLLLGKD